jgi:hypothetical protein
LPCRQLWFAHPVTAVKEGTQCGFLPLTLTVSYHQLWRLRRPRPTNLRPPFVPFLTDFLQRLNERLQGCLAIGSFCLVEWLSDEVFAIWSLRQPAKNDRCKAVKPAILGAKLQWSLPLPRNGTAKAALNSARNRTLTLPNTWQFLSPFLQSLVRRPDPF